MAYSTKNIFRTLIVTVLALLLSLPANAGSAAAADRSCRSHKNELINFSAELINLWERSRPGMRSAVEQGAVIVSEEDGEGTEFIRYIRVSDKPANTLPTGFRQLVADSVERLRYIVHSHPFRKGVPFVMSNGVKVTPNSQTDIDRPSPRDYSTLPPGVLGFLVTRIGLRVYNRHGIRCTVRWDAIAEESDR